MAHTCFFAFDHRCLALCWALHSEAVPAHHQRPHLCDYMAPSHMGAGGNLHDSGVGSSLLGGGDLCGYARRVLF